VKVPSPDAAVTGAWPVTGGVTVRATAVVGPEGDESPAGLANTNMSPVMQVTESSAAHKSAIKHLLMFFFMDIRLVIFEVFLCFGFLKRCTFL
jgi:hypothetical protein